MGHPNDDSKVNKGVHTSPQDNLSDVAGISTEEIEIDEEPTASMLSDPCVAQKPSTVKYQKMQDTTTTTSDPTEDCPTSEEQPKRLYLMKTRNRQIPSSPSKIEFRLYNGRGKRQKLKRKPSKCKSCICSNTAINMPEIEIENNFVNRLKTIFAKMRPRSAREEPVTKVANNGFVERVDVYCFDHGNFTYFRTTDCPPQILSEVLANQTTHYATRFWAEIFGSLHIGVTFFITFFMQAYRFLLYSIVRPIITGFLQMTSDYFIKPIFTISFNAFLQPPLVLVYNILSSLRDTLQPIAATIENFLKPVATILKAFRLVSFTTKNQTMKVQGETV